MLHVESTSPLAVLILDARTKRTRLAHRPVDQREHEAVKAPRCYLDTCVVSGITKENLARAELEAVRVLLGWHQEGRISLVTSDVMTQEMSGIPARFRFRPEAIHDLLAKVSSIVPLTTLGLMGLPGMRPGSFKLRTLQHFLSDVPDARHIFAAWKRGLDYVVTIDKNTILNHGQQLNRHFNIVALRPSELVSRLGDAPRGE